MINNPTHISDTYSSCIDLIFTSQPNLVVESGVHPSFYPNCHHQIIFAKFYSKIHYPPLFYRQVWYYQEADTELIRQAIDLFDWKKAFENTSVDEKVAIFNKTSLSILHNFIPRETLLLDNKDFPWLTNKIANLINGKDTVFKYFCQNSNNLHILNKLESFQNLLTKSVAESKRNYYSRMAHKLHNTHISSKAYW